MQVEATAAPSTSDSSAEKVKEEASEAVQNSKEPDTNVKNENKKEEEEEEDDGDDANTSTDSWIDVAAGSDQARIPLGHTSFSWQQPPNTRVPCGHTAYTWTSVAS